PCSSSPWSERSWAPIVHCRPWFASSRTQGQGLFSHRSSFARCRAGGRSRSSRARTAPSGPQARHESSRLSFACPCDAQHYPHASLGGRLGHVGSCLAAAFCLAAPWLFTKISGCC